MQIRALESIEDSLIIAKGERLEPELFPDVIISPTGNVRITSTLPNFETLVNAYGIKIRYNVISKEIEAILSWSTQTDLNYVSAEITSQCNMNGFPKGDVANYIYAVAMKNEYNPIVRWINSKAWDGKDRFQEVLDCIGVEKGYEEAKRVYLKRWCYSAVGMLDNDGSKGYEGVLVFQGEQGLGKTMWVEKLIGNMSQYFIDGLQIDPHSKDSVATAVSHWIVEVGELDATFKKAEIAALKAFFTSKKDRFRRPFDRYDSTYPRTTVFFASVNPDVFLKDPTGNRRYWCLNVKSLTTPKDYDAQQYWAQINVMMQEEGNKENTHKWYLTKDEQLLRDSLNGGFSESNPIEEAIERKFPLTGDLYLLTSTDVALILQLPQSQANTSKIGAVLKEMYGEPKRTSRARYYKMPLPRDSNVFDYKNNTFERYQGDLL